MQKIRFKTGWITLILLLVIVQYAHSQVYDLIVNTRYDSIACHIDSISAGNIYFEMRNNNNRIHTYYNKNQVLDYKLKRIRKQDVTFKRGTSFIKSPDSISLNSMKRNSIYFSGGYLLYHFTVNLGYERILYSGNNAKKIWSFRAACGMLDGKGKILLGTFNNLRGKGKNKLEMNIGAAYIDESHSYSPNYITIVLNAGYRRQSPDGKYVFRAGLGYPEGLYLSYGYSF